MLVILTLLVILGSLAYYYLTHNYGYWEKQGVAGPKPKLIVGTLPSTYNKRVHLFDELSEIYKTYKGKQSVVGIYRGIVPELLVLDPEIAKSCMTTHFKHFGNPGSNFGTIDKETDPLGGRNPFFLKGEEWKEKRAEILPAFSSGRIKALFPVMQAVADNMKKYIKMEMKNNEDIETRELSAKFTTDVVCNAIYGVDSGALSGQPSELRDIARNVFTLPWLNLIAFSLSPTFPWLLKLFKVRFVTEEAATFLTDLLNQTLKYRKDSKIERQDFMDFLIHLQEKKGITDVETAAHTITFFLDGIETSSITLSFVLYELAKDKQVQQKLRELLNEIKREDGTFDYESVVDLAYLDQVLIESMRLHPAAPQLTRECTETFNMELPEGKTVTIEKGINIGWPIAQIFRDPEYYGPTADQFDPDRFNEENGGMKQYKDKGVLFPFGDGPRICLGQRFAQTQIKCCIAHLVTTFDISVSPNMPEKPEYNPMELLLCYKGGILLKFKPIEN